MQVTKLKVAGFKSFVEPTELHIEPGLTGIVGPNGCGKSNLVEAMRWVMGETAPRQMRGGGMEDVIFGGTARRPAYDLAAVTLSLDNPDRRALPGLGDAAEIEVTRCIERGEGSAYTVNGRDVRARDVQLLFADAATGAHSAALVGQGRIGDIIGAKPVQRRALLEEAAGITGLHARRHEAELKLRAAETNLERLQDVIGTLETQLRDLERQARHAKRYTRLSERIRETEAALLLLRWLAARARVEAVTREADDAARRVAEATEAAATSASRQADAAAVLPERRRQEAERAAALHRLRIEHERLAEEEERVARAREENAGRRAQIAADIEREQALAQDAEAAQQRLEEAHERLARAAEGDAAAEAAARTAREEARAEVEAVEQQLAALAGARARAEAERESLGRRIEETRGRKERLQRDLSNARDERAALEQDAPADGRMTEAEAAEQAELAASRPRAPRCRRRRRRGPRPWTANARSARRCARPMPHSQAARPNGRRLPRCSTTRPPAPAGRSWTGSRSSPASRRPWVPRSATTFRPAPTPTHRSTGARWPRRTMPSHCPKAPRRWRTWCARRKRWPPASPRSGWLRRPTGPACNRSFVPASAW